jgi:hypothetical protein
MSSNMAVSRGSIPCKVVAKEHNTNITVLNQKTIFACGFGFRRWLLVFSFVVATVSSKDGLLYVYHTYGWNISPAVCCAAVNVLAEHNPDLT